MAMVAYLAEGKLYVLREGQEKAQLVESVFAQQIMDRVERSRQRNDWKADGLTWNLGRPGIGPMGMELPAEMRRIRFTGVTAGPAGKIYYAMDTDYVGGLFEYELAEGYERRLFHRNGFRISDLARHPKDGMLAFSLQRDDGTACIAAIEAEGRGLRELTEGDSMDEAPSWALDEEKAVVFQSAGIGRNQAGVRIALSPYCIQKLDLAGGQWQTLLEDEAYDYLMPRMGVDGSLYCVRRPYQPHGPMVSPWQVALDIVLFPVRLARAIVHFLNVFSVFFSRKPLITSGGPPREGPDARQLMLWGRLIDTQKALRQQGEVGAIVPEDWELVRLGPDGVQKVLAHGVLAFDLGADGSLICTNGGSITRVDADGKTQTLASGHLIERVAAGEWTAAVTAE